MDPLAAMGPPSSGACRGHADVPRHPHDPPPERLLPRPRRPGPAAKAPLPPSFLCAPHPLALWRTTAPPEPEFFFNLLVTSLFAVEWSTAASVHFSHARNCRSGIGFRRCVFFSPQHGRVGSRHQRGVRARPHHGGQPQLPPPVLPEGVPAPGEGLPVRPGPAFGFASIPPHGCCASSSLPPLRIVPQ